MKILSAILGYYGFSADSGTIHATVRFLGAWLLEGGRQLIAVRG
jgi:hypothetical protein